MPTSGAIVWFTGLSGAGKSTLASAVEKHVRGKRAVELLDGDEVRKYICEGLGYTHEDRDKNVHRMAYVARLLAKHGVLVLVAAISPYERTREELRELSRVAGHELMEIYVNAPLETVVARDVKGLYKKALSGEIDCFTGVSDPYEPPKDPALEVRTDQCAQDSCLKRILALLASRGLIDA